MEDGAGPPKEHEEEKEEEKKEENEADESSSGLGKGAGEIDLIFKERRISRSKL